MNLKELPANSVRIAEDLRLRVAGPQICTILDEMGEHFTPDLQHYRNLWAGSNVMDADGRRILWEPLPRDGRRYVVAEYLAPLNRNIAWTLQHVSTLCSGAEIELGCSFSWLGKDKLAGMATSCGSSQDFEIWMRRHTFKDDDALGMVSPDKAYFDEVSCVLEKLRRSPTYEHQVSGVPDLRRALTDYWEVARLPKNVFGLRFVGRFAILESLVTRKPDPSDPYSSIQKQVIGKSRLLHRKFIRRVDTPRYFQQMDWKTMWKKLYGLRSCYAHGSKPDDKQVKALGGLDNAEAFLVDVLRSVMRQALEEPALLMDLREA